MWCKKAAVAILIFAVVVLAAAGHVPDSHFLATKMVNAFKLKAFQVECEGRSTPGKTT